MYYPLIVLGLVCLISPWLGRMSRYEISRKSFDLVGIAGMFFLLAASFGLGMNLVDLLHDSGKVMMVVSFVLGWIALRLRRFGGLLALGPGCRETRQVTGHGDSGRSFVVDPEGSGRSRPSSSGRVGALVGVRQLT